MDGSLRISAENRVSKNRSDFLVLSAGATAARVGR